MQNKPLFSSSSQLAIFFAALIGVAAVLTLYQIYLLGMRGDSGALLLKLTLALLLFIAVGLFTVSHYVTERFKLISQTARSIVATGDLSQRIPVDRRADDVVSLSNILNDMLDRIESLMQGIRTVTDNIAHDLRTPLTRLRNHIEQLRAGSLSDDPTTRHSQLSALMAECDTLLATFAALLRIASIESGQYVRVQHSVDLHLLLTDIVELYEPIAAEKQVSLRYSGMASHVSGDKDLLFQAFANLVDNAVKYSPHGAAVSVRLAEREQEVFVEIEDGGPGVALALRAKIFERFYRTDASRHTPGIGLGLSLVKAIFDLHKAAIDLHDGERGGLLVRVIF